MRFVPIPKPQKPEDEEGNTIEDAPAMSWKAYLLKFILRDDRLSATMAGMQAAINIRDSVLALDDSATHHEIHDHDWALVLPVVVEPMAGGGIKFAAPLLAHGNAYKSADTRKPKTKTTEAPADASN